MKDYQIHELALLIPPMSQDEYYELKEDIKVNGLITPITLYEDKILDGRHRYRVCQELGIEATFETYEGDQPAHFVLSKNIFRRNLTSSQKAIVATDILPFYEKEAKERQNLGQRIDEGTGRAAEQVANIIGTNRQYVSDAKKLKEENPELFDQVKMGEKTINEAKKQLKKEKEREARLAAIKNVENKRLILGDSLFQVEKLEDKSVDLLLTDPPYGMDFKSGWSDNEKIENDKKDEALTILDNVLQASLPKLKDNAHAYIFGTWKHIPEFKAIIEKYFTLKNLLIWNRQVIGMGDLDNYGEMYDVIYFCTMKNQRFLNGQREPNILNFQRVSPNELKHPTEKPLDLLTYLIGKSTIENEVVFDPFMGSGSTCLAAKNSNRQYIGIEIQEEYYSIAKERLL